MSIIVLLGGSSAGSELWEARSKPSLLGAIGISLVRIVMEEDRWYVVHGNVGPSSSHELHLLEGFIDNFITSRCISSVRPLSFFPTAYSFLFILPLMVFMPTILALCWQTFWTASHLCILHSLHSFICFSLFSPGTAHSQVFSSIYLPGMLSNCDMLTVLYWWYKYDCEVSSWPTRQNCMCTPRISDRL